MFKLLYWKKWLILMDETRVKFVLVFFLCIFISFPCSLKMYATWGGYTGENKFIDAYFVLKLGNFVKKGRYILNSFYIFCNWKLNDWIPGILHYYGKNNVFLLALHIIIKPWIWKMSRYYYLQFSNLVLLGKNEAVNRNGLAGVFFSLCRIIFMSHGSLIFNI